MSDEENQRAPGAPDDAPAAESAQPPSGEPRTADTRDEVPSTEKDSHKQSSTARPEKPPRRPPSASPPSDDDADEDDDGDEQGMLRMSFMEHLEEFRSRIIKALIGIGISFGICIVFAERLWLIVSEPAKVALEKIGASPNLAQIEPMDVFMTVWVKLPMLAAIFVASPWILYQVWAFIAPGLYKRERRWAAPFVICSAGLFILGGLFAYFVAFRFGLAFLLGIGTDINITPVVHLTKYFDLFVNVTLGVGLVFEMPVLIFFLTLLRIVTPRFLIRNSRYAVLIIVVIAAIITPTPDVVNLMLFSVPMTILYFVGILAGYILNVHRDEHRFPWFVVLTVLFVVLLAIAGGVYYAAIHFGIHFQNTWPYIVR